MTFNNKLPWWIITGSTALSTILILRYFREKDETERKRKELELLRETQRLAEEALTQNAAILNQKMDAIVNHYNEEADRKMEEFKRQIEEGKKNDEFKSYVERLAMTVNKLTENN